MWPQIITWRFFHYWELFLLRNDSLFLLRNDSAAFQLIPHDLSYQASRHEWDTWSYLGT
jgi:hypothetical protein